MTDKYYSTASEAGGQAISTYIWRVMQPAMIGLGKWTATGTAGEALGWVNKPDGSPGDPGADPITAWLSPTLDTVTGRWLVKSPRNYLIAETASNGGLSVGYRPNVANLDGIVPAAFANATEWAEADGADLAFLLRDAVTVAELAEHIDRKTITRNRHIVAKDQAFITDEREAA